MRTLNFVAIGIGVAILGVSSLIAAKVSLHVKGDPEKQTLASTHAMTIMASKDLSMAITMTPSMIIGNGPSYTFAPTDDITAPELATVLKMLMPALTCHNALGTGCDVVPAIEASAPNVRRHFRKD